jgi:hypothetical protein
LAAAEGDGGEEVGWEDGGGCSGGGCGGTSGDEGHGASIVGSGVIGVRGSAGSAREQEGSRRSQRMQSEGM